MIKNIRRKFWTLVGKGYVFLAKLIKNHKKTAIISSAVLLVAAGTFFGALAWKQHKFNSDPKNKPQVYEALVNVVDQKSKDPVEDARSSLKKGDVIAYFPEGHPWSETERISYLIVKIKLRSDEAKKLTEAETKEIKKAEKGSKGDNGIKGEERERDMGPRMETIRARKYTLDLPGYNLQKFWENHEQPFSDRMFDGGIIDKK